MIWRLALAGVSFGIHDPIFGLDAGFYVFRLPALEIAHRAALATVLITLVAVALSISRCGVWIGSNSCRLRHSARRHLLGLVALLLVLFGGGYLLANSICCTPSEVSPSDRDSQT